MSGTYKAIGINLKSTPLGESDRLLTVLTDVVGLVRIVAPGARKHKSSLSGRSSLFVVNDLLIARGRTLDKVIQAESLESFPGISQNLAKLTAAQYLVELTLFQALADHAQTDLLCLLREHLRRIETLPSGATLAALVHGTFHLLALAGLTPQFSTCCVTQKAITAELLETEPVSFSVAAGGTVRIDQLDRVAKPILKVASPAGRYRTEPVPSADRLPKSPDFLIPLNSTDLTLLQQLTQPNLIQDWVEADSDLLNLRQNWLTLERALRHYAQYHFDRPIRSADLIDVCFAAVDAHSPGVNMMRPFDSHRPPSNSPLHSAPSGRGADLGMTSSGKTASVLQTQMEPNEFKPISNRWEPPGLQSAPLAKTEPTESIAKLPEEPLENSDTGHGNPFVDLLDAAIEVASDADHGDAGHNGSAASADGEISESEPDEATERGLLPVLRNRNFLTLWGGQVFSQLADKVYLVLMIALIASRFQTEGQAISGWVSTLMIAFTIPAVLFGSVAGVFVDHWRKRAVLVTTNLLRGGLVLGLPVLLWLTHGWATSAGLPLGFPMVLGVTFLVSTLTQFFAPAEQAVIPLIVERRHLLSANSLYTMTMMASVIIGFALGEPLLAIADQIFAPLLQQFHAAPDMGKEIVVGGSYVIAGLMLMLIRTGEKTVNPHEELPDVWENIRDGVRYLAGQGRVRAALICQVILFSIFAALAVLAVRLAEVMPEIKSSQFGFLLAAGGVGMAIGAILVGQFGQRFSRAQLSLYGSLGMAGSLAAVSFFTHHLFPTLLLLVLLGVCAAIVGVPMQTAIQEETPEEMRGKVFGLQNNAINIALSLPLALAGVAETWFGLQAVFLGLTTLALGGGILTWSISRGHNPVK